MLVPAGLGFTPTSEPMVLSNGGDFIFSLSLKNNATFPPGTLVWIQWNNGAQSVWHATVSGGNASWDITYPNTTPAWIPNGTKYSLYISYPDGPGVDTYLWYTGWARRID